MRTFAKTLIALIAAGGLWALIYFYEYRGEAGRLEAQEAESRVFAIDEASISSLEVSGPGKGVTLRREGDDWAIVDPLETRADENKVSSLMSAAARLRVEETLEDVPESELESFGLLEPTTRVTVAADGAETMELALGGRVPVTGGTYAMRKGEPAVLVVTGAVESLSSAGLDSLRDKKVVGVDLWKLSAFSLSGEGETTLRAIRHEDAWRLEEPVSFAADQEKIRDLWTGLAWLEAQRVDVEKPEPEDLAARGLDRPALRLTVETEKGEFHVDFGGTDESGAIFVKRSDMDAVMTIARDSFDRLHAALTRVDDLRDARLAPVDRFRLEKLEIIGKAAPIVLVRNDDGSWSREGGEGHVPRDRIDPLLDAIEELRAGGFEAGGSEDPPELTMTISERTGEDGEEASVVTIRLLEEATGDGDSRRMLSTISPATVYSVPRMTVQSLIDRIAALDEPVDDSDGGETE